ncbi:MAG TPA: hypothetical protein VIC08_08250 [Cellvibrionaceae bacterium]
MNKSDFLKFVNEYSFIEAGEICCINDRFDFKLQFANDEHGFVYLWVEVSEHAHTMVYVGKAGKTLKARCNQHLGGFRGGSSAGLKNANLLRNGMDNGYRYFLYARKSPLVKMCGEDNINYECVEELAFIKKFKSTLWNRA